MIKRVSESWKIRRLRIREALNLPKTTPCLLGMSPDDSSWRRWATGPGRGMLTINAIYENGKEAFHWLGRHKPSHCFPHSPKMTPSHLRFRLEQQRCSSILTTPTPPVGAYRHILLALMSVDSRFKFGSRCTFISRLFGNA